MKVSTQLNEQLEALKKQRKVEKIRVLVELERVDIERLNVLAEDFKVKYNAEITYRIKAAPYFSMLVDSDKVELIAEAPFVKKLWHIPKVYLLDEIILPESVKHITADRVKQAGYTGSGIKVAVVDTGIEKTHPMLVGKVIAEKNFTAEPDAGDYHGHGTWCASCVAGNSWMSPVGLLEGVAPGALLINSKIFDASASCDIDTAMAALEWACEQGAHISSNSWGNGYYEPIRNLIINLKATYGTIFVFAAGNDGPGYGSIAYPGGFPEVVGVGSIAVKSPDKNAVASFSGRGPNWQGDIKPDIMAPGGSESECIYAAFKGGTVKCWKGTSMATPHIAGGLALLLEAGFSFSDAVAKLYATAKDLVEVGKDNDSGFGTADFASALGLPLPSPHTLAVSSSPSGLLFYVNGDVHTTPWSGQYSEGSYIVSVEAEVYVDGVHYKFSRWEDGSTFPKRVIDLIVDLSLVFYYEEIPRYTLTVNSSPVSGINFTVQNVPKVTPYSELLETGSYTITMPASVTMAGVIYDFIRWEDGSTSLKRTIDLISDMTLTAFYELVPTYLLSVDSVPQGVSISIDGIKRVTPWMGKLLEGSHRLVTPSSITVDGVTVPFLYWENGSTSAIRDINLTSSMSVTAYYQVTPSHSLTVKSQPIAIPTSVDGKDMGYTPVAITVIEGSHIVSVPQEVTT